MDKDIFKILVEFAVEKAREIENDQKALKIKYLYKEWEKQIGRNLIVGEYIQHNDNLYRVLQDHIAQEDWIPGVGTESLYVVIDKEHEGTIEDPIPAKTNMEYFNGKYYIEEEILYLCIRDSGIALQHLPSVLVGNYFEIVTNK